MEAGRVIHPSADALRALALGKLDDDTAARVQSHLDSCPACRAQVAAANDSYATAVPADSFAEAGPRPQPPLGPTTPFNLPPELADNPNYEVLRELGRGGMGVVYQARHKLSGRLEVLKVMNKALIGQPESRERFLREIQAAARLDHKNVVKMYTALECGDLMVLVMEHVEGEDLARVVKGRELLSVLNACSYVQQAASGLQHAFEKGMVHRDIKPQNLMRSRAGDVVKVLDFGLAKATRGESMEAGLTGSGAMMGTPAYMAPEQGRDAAKADIRADIYSLGCTLYHLLAGAPPFSGKSLFEILHAHHSTEARPLNEVRPEVPAELAAVVRKMMAKAPAARYQTPAEVVRALDPFILGGPKAPPARISANRSIVWLAGLLLAGLLGIGIVLFLATRGNTPLTSNPEAVTTTEPSQTSGEDGTPNVPDGLPPSITNSIGMKFVLVKPGVFLMGSPPEEDGRGGDDREFQHEVEITRPFYVGVHEVTQQQYARVMDENKAPSWFSPAGGGKELVKGMDSQRLPVESVSWLDADKFCRLLSATPEERTEDRLYRLPTEAEWEYVCRDGPFCKKPSPPFHFGNSLSSRQANFDGNEPYGGAERHNALNRTAKVGSYPPNLLGVHDLHGNVWEWCADWYDPDYYKRSPRRDPQGPENGERRVLRGGSWNYCYGRYCRAAYRGVEAPGRRNYDFGFRLVLVAGARN